MFFKIDPYEYWIEVKTLATNYCGGGGRPITDFIHEVCMTIAKLGRIKNAERNVCLVAAFYPFCDGPREVNEWDQHLERLYECCESCLKSFNLKEEKIVLDAENGVKAKIYFIWA